jgi:aromatic-amino-acid transaminase
VDVEGMLAGIAKLPAGAIVVLHACCHNPTGVDLATGDWQRVVATVRERGLVPFLDIAYQGFGDGIEPDAEAVRLFAAADIPFLVASSFSKSFSLYGERVGALSIVTASHDEALRVQSQLKRVIRTNYSNPPTHGAAIVSAVLNHDELRAMWETELGEMRERIRAMRRALHEVLTARIPGRDFNYLLTQRGMFSYTGLSPQQVDRLRDEHAVYLIRSGRMCVAGLNSGNVEATARAMAAVI